MVVWTAPISTALKLIGIGTFQVAMTPLFADYVERDYTAAFAKMQEFFEKNSLEKVSFGSI